MSEVYNRNRRFNNIKLITDNKLSKPSIKTKCVNRSVDSAFSNVFLKTGNNDLLIIPYPGVRYINGDLSVYGTRNCGFRYIEAENDDPFYIINEYSGNYMLNLSVRGDCDPNNIIYYNIYVNDILMSNLTGVLIPLQSTTQSNGSGSLNINGLLRLNKNSKIMVVISCDGNSSINMLEFCLIITSI